MIELIEKIKTQIGDLEDECSTANRVLHGLLSRIDRENDLVRIVGTVTIDGESFDHEWCKFEGDHIDITAEQFTGDLEYSGEPTDWHRLSDLEEARISNHISAIMRELADERLDELISTI